MRIRYHLQKPFPPPVVPARSSPASRKPVQPPGRVCWSRISLTPRVNFTIPFTLTRVTHTYTHRMHYHSSCCRLQGLRRCIYRARFLHPVHPHLPRSVFTKGRGGGGRAALFIRARRGLRRQPGRTETGAMDAKTHRRGAVVRWLAFLFDIALAVHNRVPQHSAQWVQCVSVVFFVFSPSRLAKLGEIMWL